MPISQEQLEKIIRRTFPAAIVKITDLVGDQDHYLLEIADQAFAGTSLINQHRMVNQALSTILDAQLHSITIKTKILAAS